MHPGKITPSESAPRLSIVIRTFNSAKTIKRLLPFLTCRTGVEIIIIDSGSSDQTTEICSQFVSKISRPSHPFHYSKALNFGFAQSLGPWVLVISSHCIPTSTDFIDNVLRFSESADPNCVVGYGKLNVVTPKMGSLKTIGGPQTFESGKFFPGGNGLAVYRRTAWEAHPFDENIDTAEDLEWFIWAMRQGFTARFIPGLTAIYLNQGSLRHMFRKGWREVRRTRILLPDSRKSVVGASSGLFVGFAYYFWLALRQCAHALGAFLAEFFPLKTQSASK
ncbi:MAG: glycosyltransferase [Bacteroidetes bacterium]|nr:glycosyltransferase [Bacteroidota bacterium]